MPFNIFTKLADAIDLHREDKWRCKDAREKLSHVSTNDGHAPRHPPEGEYNCREKTIAWIKGTFHGLVTLRKRRGSEPEQQNPRTLDETSSTIYDGSSVGTEYLPSDLDGNSQFCIEISLQRDLQPQYMGSPSLDSSMRSTVHGAGSTRLESFPELGSPGLRAESEPVRRLSFQPWVFTMLLRDDTRSLDTADWSWSEGAAPDHDEVPQPIRLLVRNKFDDEVSLSSSEDDVPASADDCRLNAAIRANGPRQPQLESVPELPEPKIAEWFSSSEAQNSHETTLGSSSDSAPKRRHSDSSLPLVIRNPELPGHRRVKRSKPSKWKRGTFPSEAGLSSETVHLADFSPLTRCGDVALRGTLLSTDQLHTRATRLGAVAVPSLELLATVSRPESRQTTHQSASDSDPMNLTPFASSSSATIPSLTMSNPWSSMPSTTVSTPRSSIYEEAIEHFGQTYQTPNSSILYSSRRMSAANLDPHAPTQARGPPPCSWLKSSPRSPLRLAEPFPKSKLSQEHSTAPKGPEETRDNDNGVAALSGNSSPTMGPLTVFNQLVRSLSKSSSHSWRSQSRRSMDRSSVASVAADEMEETKGDQGESEAEAVRDDLPPS